MQIRWRKNPKTEDGWFKRTAISLLVGLSIFLVSLPVSFFLFLSHLQNAYPNDTQNFLAAMTSAVLVGLGLAALLFFATLAVLYLLSFRRQPVSS